MTAAPEPTAPEPVAAPQPAAATPTASSPCSVVALILGVVSLFFGNLLLILAVLVLGVIGLSRNEPSRSSAGVGMVLAGLSLLVTLFVR